MARIDAVRSEPDLNKEAPSIGNISQRPQNAGPHREMSIEAIHTLYVELPLQSSNFVKT